MSNQQVGNGRGRELTREMVIRAFEQSETPAMTIGDIAKSGAVDMSRQTVNRILREQGMAEEWCLENGKVGNATAYWPKEAHLSERRKRSTSTYPSPKKDRHRRPNEVYLRLLKSVSVLMGMLLLGAAMAFAISLATLQDAAMAQNVWPTVYSPEQGQHIYAAGKELQLLANASGIGGAVLLLAYGLFDRFEDGEPNLTESSGGVVDD